MNCTKIFISAALCLTGVFTTRAQASAPLPPVTITASADTATLTMGDRTMVNVEIVHNGKPGVYIDGMHKAGDSIRMLGNIEVRHVTSDSSRIADGRYQVNYHYQIQPFEVGPTNVGPFKYVIDGDTLTSQIVTFKVEEPNIPKEMRDSLYIHPMESTVSIPAKWYDFIPNWLPWALLAMLLVALGAVLVYLYKINGGSLIARKPIIPPFELAIRRLNKIKQRHLAESGHDKEYYTELTDVLRQYLEGRFKINAREMTSSQIIDALNADAELLNYVPSLAEVLSTADFVKFAKHQSNVDENLKNYATVFNFVKKTRPVEVAPQNQKRQVPAHRPVKARRRPAKRSPRR